ncbi:hypothetical protein [Thermoactinomyces mirandus]|uniref:Uncharacterized protein n=1 Tax=Thermoactinomyces mirandus TaxID=2756294 RepID=A0A7W1XQ91_9BACL|nr:hypothetical protein [Thermoactinomyces mirandus]MBA4601155.1 hypothetical protein [Thermoactinomyces mirandus]
MGEQKEAGKLIDKIQLPFKVLCELINRDKEEKNRIQEKTKRQSAHSERDFAFIFYGANGQEAIHKRIK